MLSIVARGAGADIRKVPDIVPDIDDPPLTWAPTCPVRTKITPYLGVWPIR
ncbi:hypothetical protein OG308_08610 [Nocardia salmonicida]|uniref:Uncharacterized protein n=1 Tax=Nocardia salmonicida TaxID=53431 RepID=A0ABZ1ND04_9NOCA